LVVGKELAAIVNGSEERPGRAASSKRHGVVVFVCVVDSTGTLQWSEREKGARASFY
jgi:uncharacterized protein GlcG (DUF336 family)